MKKYIVLGMVFVFILSISLVLEAKKKTYLVDMKLYKVTRFMEEKKVEKNISGKIFDDEVIQIKWAIKTNSLKFELRNKTGDAIFIVWEQSVFLDRNGKKLRLTHKGIKKGKMLLMMKPGEIKAGKKIKENIYPCEYFYEVPKLEVTRPAGGGPGGGMHHITEWKKRPLYKKRASMDESENSDPAAFEEDLRKPIGVLLVVHAGGFEYEYEFTFKPDVKGK